MGGRLAGKTALITSAAQGIGRATVLTMVAEGAKVIATAFADIGFDVHRSSGTYFVCADPRPLGHDDSTAFCLELPHRVGVAAIPLSAFCDPGGPHFAQWNHLVRFAFCKRDDTLTEAIERLQALR